MNETDTLKQILATLDAEHVGGISTALTYLKSFEPCFAGEDGVCPAGAFSGASFNAWKKELDAAQRRLVYHNDEMLVESKSVRTSGLSTPRAIMEFDHVITTTTKDRDNDVIETSGVTVDMSMPLLWHHMQIQPLGPFLEVTKQDDHVLAGRSAILDTKMGNDAAVLVEGGALRISQGFVPIRAEPMTEKSGGKDIVRGWHVKESKTMEVSLVSVPANTDAVITAYSRKRLRSPIFQKWASILNGGRPISVAVGADVSTLDNTVQKSFNNGNSEMNIADQINMAISSGEMKVSDLENLVATHKPRPGMTKAADVFGGATEGGIGTVTVQPPSAHYSTKKYDAKHRVTEQPMYLETGSPAQTPSQLERVKSGLLLKFWARRKGIHAPFSEHEEQLFAEMCEKDTWCGYINKEWRDGFKLSEFNLNHKALLSDSTSGGTEINPEWFDSMLVTFPLLTGELFPHVMLVPAPRGSSVEAASVGNPTVTWGTPSGTAIGLFNTDSLIAGIDTSIHPVAAALEVGRDLLADSAANIGQTLVDRIGERMTEEFDRVIAVGNGTSEPEGIFTASGVTAVSSTNGATGPPTVADFENLMSALDPQYVNTARRPAFVGNNTSYFRARGIAVDPAGNDQRRVFGMSYRDRQITEWPYRTNQSISNSTVAFGTFSSYRMYRRSAVQTEWITSDFQLARENKNGLVIRARMGGRIVDTSGWAKITDAQS